MGFKNRSSITEKTLVQTVAERWKGQELTNYLIIHTGFLMWKNRKKHFTELLESVKKASSSEERQVNKNMRKVTPGK